MNILIPALAFGRTDYVHVALKSNHDVTVSTVDAHPSIRELFLFTVD